MVLRAAELLGDRKLDLDFVGLAEVIARDLVSGIGQRLLVFLAEREIDATKACFLPELALGSGELVFARLDHALRKVPGVVGAQDEEIRAALRAAEDDHARSSWLGLGFHRAKC